MYKFVRCQPHAKCPDLQGWYLVLEPDDVDTLMKLHKGVTGLYYHKFGLDPHYQKPELGILYHPMRLSAGRFTSVEKFLFSGITLAVNSSGGMIPLDSVKVLVAEESERLIWPDRWLFETITISRWPRGRHYYLSSNRNRIFVPTKHGTYEGAHQVAKMYTTNIQDKGC